MTKMGGNPGQLEDPRPRGVWFGARAIAEFPRISQELRRRQIGGPRRKKSSSSEQILREKEVYAGETEKATIPHFPSSLVTPVGSQQRPFDRVSSPRSRSRAVGFNSGGISSVLDERPEYSGSVVESMATPFAAPNTNIRRGEKRRFEPSSEELSRDEDPVDIPRVRKKSRLLMRHFPT